MPVPQKLGQTSTCKLGTQQLHALAAIASSCRLHGFSRSNNLLKRYSLKSSLPALSSFDSTLAGTL
ncbi:MAG: hypothetical protein LDL41_24200 [Coleofasciculus sp. S288]|nr:hypothetical protein [Coleofasciculus sp. S288]